MAGPAWVAAATPVRTKMPAPMMAPMPSRVRSTGPRTLLRAISQAPWSALIALVRASPTCAYNLRGSDVKSGTSRGLGARWVSPRTGIVAARPLGRQAQRPVALADRGLRTGPAIWTGPPGRQQYSGPVPTGSDLWFGLSGLVSSPSCVPAGFSPVSIPGAPTHAARIHRLDPGSPSTTGVTRGSLS